MDVGARLRDAREARGLSIEAVARTTRIAPHWLRSIESNDVTGFPPGPYARGFVRAYARELGLDADPAVHEYFAQFEGAPETAAPAPPLPRTPHLLDLRSDRPRPTATLMAVAVVVALLAWAMWPGRGRSPEPGAVGTTGQAAARSGQGAAVPASTPAASAVPPLAVVLAADQQVWVTATADGKRVLFRILQPGERANLRAERQMTIRVGNAGAVRWTIGGRDAGTMGSPGEVRTARLTPESAATIR